MTLDALPDGFHQVESWDYNPVENGGLASFGLKKSALSKPRS